MPRTTSDLVKEIIEVDDTLGSLDPFIRMANQLVDEVCLASGYAESRLTDIETWLAAHFYCSKDPRVSSEQAAGVGQSFINRVGLFLQSSTYGQMALVLDTAGNLAKLSKQMEKGVGTPKIGIVHLGCDLTPDRINRGF